MTRLLETMKYLTLLLLLILVVGAVSASADELVLSNGDRVSGTILGLDENGLVIESEFLGTVTGNWDAVERLRSDEIVYVTSTDNRLIAGTLVVEGDAVTIDGGAAGVVQMARAQITTVRSQARQAAFLAAQQAEAAAAALWAAGLDGALSLSSGNADTRSVNLGLRAARTTEVDRTSFYLTSLFASNTTGGTSLTTANAVRSGARFERDVSGRAFTFGFADLEFDRFQDLDLRLVLGGGLGINVTESARSTLRIFGGGSSNQEFFASGVRRKSGESVAGEEWSFRINDVTSVTERLAVYANLTDRGEYRVNFDSTATTRLNDWLSWQVTLSDRYLSNPRPGKQRNDFLFTTGFRITLGEGNVGQVGPGNINFP